jgi:hypothetical protein
MSITTIQRAVGDAVGITRKKFDIIGFDACLMATVETANCLSDYGKYMAASQEIEPGGGWDYTALFNAIAAEPGSGGLEIGKVLADSYAAKCIRTKSGEGYTFSIIDMSEIDDVVDVLDELGSLAYGEIREDGANAWNELGIARMFTEEFGAMYVSNRFFNMADIEGFAERLGIVDEDTYGGICRRLVREIEDAVKYNIKGDAHEDASGLSVYLPYHVFTKAKSELPKYWDITFAPDYQDLINEYVNYPLDNPPGTRLAFSEVERAGNTLLATVSSPYDMAEIFIDVNERPAGGNYIKKSQDLVKLEDDEDGGILYTLTGRWFTFDGRPVIGYFEKGQGFWDDFDSYDIAIPVYYRRAGEPVSKNTAITIQVDYDRLLNIGTVEMAWVTEDFDNVSSKDEVVLAATDIITPIYEVYDPAKPGEKTMVNGDEFALSTGSPVYARTPVPSGIVYYNFRILDLAGNLMRSSLTEVVVP